MKQQQIIIHISGSPGAGKTTFGEELQLLYPQAIVKDTDDFAFNLSQQDGPQFIKQLEQRIQSFISKNIAVPAIILVGILDVTHDRTTLMVNMKQLTPHLFYLDVPSDQLLRQFYTRIIDIGKNDPSLWIEISKGHHPIPSSSEKLMDSERSKKQHLNMEYQIMTKLEILANISRMLCNNCQLPAKVECSSCSIAFCGNDCSAADPTHKICIKAAQYLRYRDGNYIFGTKDQFTLWRESQMVTDASGKVLFQISVGEMEKLFALLDLKAFHKRTDADQAQCCDIPYRVIEYGGGGGDWVANMDNVPELTDALYQMYRIGRPEPNPRFQTRMRAPSSMK